MVNGAGRAQGPRQTRLPATVAAWLPLLLVGALPATAQVLEPVFLVNTYTTDGQRDARVAADGAGNFLVVWMSEHQDSADPSIFAQWFDAAGDKVGGEFQVGTYTTGYQWSPAVAANAAGDFVVVWNSQAQDGSYTGVFGQRYDTQAGAVGSPFQVNTETISDQKDPSVAVSGSGSFLVAWDSSEQDGSEIGVFAQLFDPAGGKVGGEIPVNTYTTDAQAGSEVSVDRAGKFVVVWSSFGQDGSHHGVFGQRFDAAGGELGGEFQVNTYVTGLQGKPAVAASGNGDFVVAWESYGQDGSAYAVIGRRFVAGVPGGEFQVNTYTTSYQSSPAVAIGRSGDFVVAFESRGEDASYYAVIARRYSATGSPLGIPLQLNVYETGSQRFPAIAADGAGDFVVTWQSEGQDGSGYGVYGRRLAVGLFADDFENGDVCAWSDWAGSTPPCL